MQTDEEKECYEIHEQTYFVPFNRKNDQFPSDDEIGPHETDFVNAFKLKIIIDKQYKNNSESAKCLLILKDLTNDAVF